MPWKKSRGFDGTSKNKENDQGKVDQLPLVTSSENTDSAIASADSESKSENSSVTANKQNSHTPKRHVTTVTISHCDGATECLQQRQSAPSHQLPIISYEKNKSVRIIVKEPGLETPPESLNRQSRCKDAADDEKGYWRGESFSGKGREVNDWIENQRHGVTDPRTTSCSPEKHKDEEGVKVRPLLEASWRAPSHTSVLDEPPSSDDCQRSTSTLVNTNISKIGKSSNECQRGFVSVFCGISVVVGSAVCLRLPTLLFMYGTGSFLLAFGVCLVIVAVPLAFLESGLAQFSNNSVIGIWSLVPLFRGIGWSIVVGCLYWGATTAGLAAPWFHYVIAQNDPDILQVPNMCRLLNGSEFDSVTYYRHCVYNLSSSWEKGVDLTLTWSLPAGLITILMIASLSVTGGPSLLAFISASGSLLAITGHGIQFYVSYYELRWNEKYGLQNDLTPLLRLLIPDHETLTDPQIWLAAMSQALLCLGPGVGMLLNHSANNVFRYPLRRHLWFLTTLTVLTTILVTITTLFEAKIFADHSVLPSNNKYEVAEGSDITLKALTSQQPEIQFLGNGSFADKYYAALPVKNCILYSNSLTDLSCTKIPPGLVNGVPFIVSSHLVTFATGHFPWWLAAIFKNMIFLGFLGAGIATCSVCMHVGVVAAREARSIPPAAAALILMAVLSLVAAPMSTQAGASFIYLVDHYVLMPGLMWPSVATLIGLATCHGVAKIRKDMTFMLESTVSYFWLPIWAGVVPILLLVITVWTFIVDWKDLGFITEPGWCVSIVWSLRFGLLISIPITAIIVINSQLAYGFKDKVLSSLQSSREWGDWGPQDPIEHHNWRRWREDETRSYASLERRLASKSRPLTYTHSTLSSSSSSTLGRLRAKYRGQAKPSNL